MDCHRLGTTNPGPPDMQRTARKSEQKALTEATNYPLRPPSEMSQAIGFDRGSRTHRAAARGSDCAGVH
jgi:hypothetical protein